MLQSQVSPTFFLIPSQYFTFQSNIAIPYPFPYSKILQIIFIVRYYYFLQYFWNFNDLIITFFRMIMILLSYKNHRLCSFYLFFMIAYYFIFH